MPIGRLLLTRMTGTHVVDVPLVSQRHFKLNMVLVLMLNFLHQSLAVCPHCHGHFSSCTFDEEDGTCPTIAVVGANAAAFAAGSGTLCLSDIIPCRYLKMFTRSSLDSRVGVGFPEAPELLPF